ncbi:serine hydrolase domain-containing protein [Paenibacillus donghaensis]|uniref:Serine hydrolase n=1 Tax=Paenibacillus donghaensis TaxID=414771 RepID=A0A2Z2KJM8_9BACL|nr:serine hydrolase [Paenibacillus donghaensis]ASA22529.1 serine hydrolase [Paenibacillus donghaensis]
MNLSLLAADLPSLQLRSCLINRRGEPLLQYYQKPAAETEIARINSCTKSILSALICIAMDQGLLPPPETAVSRFYPQLAADKDTRKAQLTLSHLLTMSAGFNWTEFGGQNSFPKMTRSPNWVEFVLGQPLAHPPGQVMEYNSGVSQLLSAILMQAVERPVTAFAEQYLFGPLGITAYSWESDPQGIATGGFGMSLRPADLLKFGQLYLQQGKWGDRQLITPERVIRSVQPAIDADPPRRGGYAWHWWTDVFPDPDSSSTESAPILEYYYARGYGEQFVYVLPAQETVVVLTKDQKQKQQPPLDVFRDCVAPALLDRYSSKIN